MGFGHSPAIAMRARDNTSFSVYRNHASQDIEEGSELYESYCGTTTDCHNAKFLEIWGVFLEDNALPESERWKTLRRGHNCSASTGPGGTAATLQEATEAALDMAVVWPSDVVAPRCRQAVRNSIEQG